jgi:hypothetical protein
MQISSSGDTIWVEIHYHFSYQLLSSKAFSGLAGGVAQMVERLPSQPEVLSVNASTTKINCDF